ncbi:hypothetical protein E1211_19215 [Micromonospora sp. 15K316]|uniref:hypothetical protein n=1 Tax=Micromonospora sp. 15K316 TaxID=2530376 RepID=UPI001052DB26|nr:hypothetical protein [Micromonospora sp. 15K316]TDC33443.1 hypothetical protein E1211_19215 [Micromonospora sp. 15K316]
MSRDLSDFYRSLAADADGHPLDGPGELRRRADRRARARAAGGVLVVALLVAGTATGTRLVLAADQGPVGPPAGPPAPTVTAPTPSPSPVSPSPSRTTPSPAGSASATAPRGGTPSTSNTSPAPRTPTSIPDRAFFTPPASTTAAPPAFRQGDDVLPEFCGADLDGRVVQTRSRVLTYHLTPNQPEGTVPYGIYRNSITIHRPGRADDWMDDVRQAVRECPEQEAAQGRFDRHRLLPGGDFGDEALLIEVREPAWEAGEPAEGEVLRLIRVIRIGDVVTVLWEMGWEGTSSDRRQVDDYSRRAEQAISNWLD